MKIQMIGHSRAGKTTFMAAMYRVMKEEDGYQLRVRNRQERRQLNELGDDLEQGIYPPGTAVKSQYKFDFSYDDEKLFNFKWMDYRGGVLEGMLDDRDMLMEVDRCANQCESMIVFVDGTTMNSKEGLRQWNHLVTFILRFAGRANYDTPLSLTIILTKMDLCTWDCDFEETLVGKKMMKTIQQIRMNRNLSGMLAFSTINEDTFGNTFFSVLHAMSIPLEMCIDREIDKIQEVTRKRGRLNPSLMDDLFSWWNGVPSDRQVAQDLDILLEERQDKLRMLRKHVKKMRKILKKNAEDSDYILFGKMNA